MEDWVEWLKFGLPAGLVLCVAYLMVRAFMGKRWQTKALAEGLKISLSLRLQAYERMCLFLERTSITNLLPRVAQSGLAAKEMQHILLREIREEFNHNLSQQLYMSPEAWGQVKAAMEENVMLINRSAEELPQAATQADLIKQIFKHMSEQKYDPTENALLKLKAEVQTLF